MKTYFRILRYARPFLREIILHAIFILISVILVGLTFRMLQPLLEFLFYRTQAAPKLAPHFRLSVEYLQEWVEYKAGRLVVEQGVQMALLFVTSAIVIFNVAGNVFRYFAAIYLSIIRTKVIENLRRQTFEKLLSMHVGYIENQRKGDILTRLTSDIAEVEQSVVVTFEALLRDPITIIFFLALMINISWQLTLFMLLMLPVTAIIVSTITKKLKRDAFGAQDMHGYIMSVSDETVTGMRIIKAFNAEGYVRRVFDKYNSTYSRLTRQLWFRRALVPSWSESSGVITVGIIMWFGGTLVYTGKMPAAAFISYIALVSQIIRPAKSFSQAFGNLYKGIASAERIFELVDAPIVVDEPAEAQSLKSFERDIVFSDVSFRYIEEEVLKNINLRFEKGKIYGLVGPSGSGKSTLVELLLRFYDPQSGSVSIDGIDLKHIRFEELRRLMAVVTQEPILFNDTIRNNIAFGLENVSDEDIIRAAKAANAHEFIVNTEQGYNTNIGDRGALLSGGQRQRISIARAVLKNPPILILDEATSALDTNSEKIVQDALYKLMQNRTSIVIAHRLSTIINADSIIVLEKGRILEQGNHEALIAIKGLYYSLYTMQQVTGNR